VNATFDPDGPKAARLRAQIRNPVKMAAFLGAKLPMALLAGIRVTHLDASACTTTVRYRWLTTNPFRSTYFAVLAMAAEMSTGALGLTLVQAAPVPVSILVVGMEAEFVKKATGLTTFTCSDGQILQDAVKEALRSGEGVTATTRSVGVDASGDVVARFTFTWSFRRKASA
jgi:hypothetical protein